MGQHVIFSPPSRRPFLVQPPPPTDPELLRQLKLYLRRRPLAFFRPERDLCVRLTMRPDRIERFTATWNSDLVTEIKVPTLCIVEFAPDPAKDDVSPRSENLSRACYLAVIERRDKVASFETRLKFVAAIVLRLPVMEALGDAFAEKSHRQAFLGHLPKKHTLGVLSPLLIDEVLEWLWQHEEEAIRRLACHLPGVTGISDAERQQADAIDLAKAFFGLRESQERWHRSDEFHAQEKNAINRDAAEVPGFDLIKADLKGTTRFRKGDEELVIYNAHQGPIEELLGVDLVYVNEIQGSIVMVQYKMLEPTDGANRRSRDWIFRPDGQFRDEVARMRLPPLGEEPTDYRMHRDPFFFKFVRRKQRPTDSDTGLVLSVEHLQRVLADHRSRGPQQGVRLSYSALGGQYLRESDFVGFVRSGYLGTHRIEYAYLKKILALISGEKRGLVLGWQYRVQNAED